jgi:hypothetical protein
MMVVCQKSTVASDKDTTHPEVCEPALDIADNICAVSQTCAANALPQETFKGVECSSSYHESREIGMRV